MLSTCCLQAMPNWRYHVHFVWKSSTVFLMLSMGLNYLLILQEFIIKWNLWQKFSIILFQDYVNYSQDNLCSNYISSLKFKLDIDVICVLICCLHVICAPPQVSRMLYLSLIMYFFQLGNFKVGSMPGASGLCVNVPSYTWREIPQMSLEGLNWGRGVGFPLSSHVSCVAQAWLFKGGMWTCGLFPQNPFQ